ALIGIAVWRYPRSRGLVILIAAQHALLFYMLFAEDIYKAKYTAGESDEIIPARISETEKQLIENISSKIYRRLNCRGVVRIDYIIKNGEPWFLEVNTVPGMSQMSIVPKMAIASGLSLSEFFGRLLEEAKAG
ncbi:MAG: hypothetical protein ACHQFW_12175, partial [Chitinophagales bacterium]